MDEDLRTIFCRNLSEKVSEETLYELFLQGGPVEKVSIPKDYNGKKKSYGFVTYKHQCSVPYALELFEGVVLYNRALIIQTRNNTSDSSHQQSFQRQTNSYNNNNPYMNSDQNNLMQQMKLGNLIPPMLNMLPGLVVYPSQMSQFSNNSMQFPQNLNSNNGSNRNNNRHQARSHPYQRERDSNYDRHGNHHDSRNNHYNTKSHRQDSRSDHYDNKSYRHRSDNRHDNRQRRHR